MLRPKRLIVRAVFGLAAAYFAVAAVPMAQAHPHIWIKNRPTLNLEKGRIVSVSQDWTFDSFFSAALIKDFDRNKDAKFDAAEIALLRKHAFTALKDFGFFTHARVDGKKIAFSEVKAFSAKIADGKVIYSFTLAVPAPVDPRKTKAAFLFYDHTYYVDVALSGSPLVALKNAGGCSLSVRDDTANPIYFGLVVPKMAVVSCAAG